MVLKIFEERKKEEVVGKKLSPIIDLIVLKDPGFGSIPGILPWKRWTLPNSNNANANNDDGDG